MAFKDRPLHPTGASRLKRYRALCLACALAASASLPGCRGEGQENLGVSEGPRSHALDARALARPGALAGIAALPHAELVRHLGAHIVSSHTSWRITPSGPSRPDAEALPASLEEEATIESDGKGALRVLHDNDHGYGTEAVLLSDSLYMRLRYQPFAHRRPEGDEVARLLRAADNSAALLGLLSPFTEVGKPEEVTAFGRPAFKLQLSRRATPLKELRPRATPGQAWRQATTVEALEGAAIVDRDGGVLLGLRLHATFQAPRGAPDKDKDKDKDKGRDTPSVRVEVTHRATVDRPADGVEITRPREAIDAPARPRPMLDHQDLLDGLVPRAQRH
jgi:hypothetical protein